MVSLLSLDVNSENAGLILPATLAHRLGLGELVDSYVDLGDAPGRPNAGDPPMAD